MQGVDTGGSTRYLLPGIRAADRKRPHQVAFTESHPPQPVTSPRAHSRADSRSQSPSEFHSQGDRSAGTHTDDDYSSVDSRAGPPPAVPVPRAESDISVPVTETSEFRKAVNETYRLIPRDICPMGSLPRPLPAAPTGSIARLEQGEGITDNYVVLPHSGCIRSTLDFLEQPPPDIRGKPSYQTPFKDVKALMGLGTYKPHTPTFASEAPPLEPEAVNTDLKEESTITVKMETLKRWETRVRGLVDALSYAELFNTAQYIQNRSRPSADYSSPLLVSAQERTIAQSLAGAVSLAVDLTRVRRDAVLSSSKQLSSAAKRTLRVTPLHTNTLFGGQLPEVLEKDRKDYERQAIIKVATAAPARAKTTSTRTEPKAKKPKASSSTKRRRTSDREPSQSQRPESSARGRGAAGRYKKPRGSSRPPRGRGNSR